MAHLNFHRNGEQAAGQTEQTEGIEGNLTKQTAVTILLTHIACVTPTYTHTHTLEQLLTFSSSRFLARFASFDLALFEYVELGIKLSAPF